MQNDDLDIISTTKAFWLRKVGATLSDEEAREAVENITGFFSCWKNGTGRIATQTRKRPRTLASKTEGSIGFF